MTNVKIVNLPIEHVVPYWNNARKNHRAIKVVEKSIEEYGFNQPVVVVEVCDNRYEIVVGHTRYFAMKNLGHSVIPSIIATLTPEEAQKYRIADNSIKDLTEWDESKLIQEILSIQDKDMLQNFMFDDIGSMLRFSSPEEIIEDAETSFEDETPSFTQMETVSAMPTNAPTLPTSAPAEIHQNETIECDTGMSEAKGFRCPHCDCLIEDV